ncbi:sugar ABC transporter permease [Truepera radiovictrix]|nr:ABC transporter permease subunit [Truepera radiovictrix]WMT56292.1 ABC transporter permease subunit [Truepera radiovictrix]
MVGLCGYLYGRATKPMKAFRTAITWSKHLFLWVAVLLTLYPVIYLVGVSFGRSNALASIPPREGNLLVRAGVLPNPADFSLVQYRRVLADTHLYPYQWGLLALFTAAALLFVLLSLARRSGKEGWVARLQRLSGWIMLAAVALLVVTLSAEQFYTLDASGQRRRASSGGMMVLYIRNTLLVSGMTGLFAVLISTTAGYAFARMRFEGRYGTLLAFVFVQMFPSFMALVAIFYLMNYLGLLNTFTGLILAYSGGAIAFSSWIFKGYLESISPNLEEAAMVDGATRWGAFWRIILPISVPMLLFIFLLQFIGTYSEFLLANVLLTSNDRWTVGLGLRALASNALATQWGTLAASAVLGSLPILVIFYAFQNALSAQYIAGGVKG